MNNINYEDVKNNCRMCMLGCDTNYFNNDSIILNIFYKLTDIHFDTNDELPQQICHKCFNFITEIHSFTMTCKRTHFALIKCLNDFKNKRIKQEQEIIEETNEETDIKEEITIEEPKFEFVKTEHDNDWETDNAPNEDVTDLLTPISTLIEEESVINSNDLKEYSNTSDNGSTTNSFKKEYKCNQCEKSFNQFNSLTRHKRVHSDERPYKCNQCEKSFIQSNNLTRHQRVHSGEQPYKCDQCEKSFKHSINLKRHSLLHSGERPFKCDQCEKSFNRSTSLTIHKRMHSGECPFKCDQCEKSFTESGTLTKHKRMHTGERPFKCDQCEKTFSESSKLIRHKRVHSGERPFNCDRCEKSFAGSWALIRHKRVHDNTNATNAENHLTDQ